MSRFVAQLTILMEEQGLPGREIAKARGLQTSLISRLRSGKQLFISRANLALIAGCFAYNRKTGEKTRRHAAELIAAHLMDENAGPGSEMVRFNLVDAGETEVDRSERQG